MKGEVLRCLPRISSVALVGTVGEKPYRQRCTPVSDISRF